MIIGGGVALNVGFALVLLSGLQASDSATSTGPAGSHTSAQADSSDTAGRSSGARTAGFIGMGVGALALVAGIVLRVDGRKYIDLRSRSDPETARLRLGLNGLEF